MAEWHDKYRLTRDDVGLLLVDIQEKLLPHVERPCETLGCIIKIVRGFQILQLPIVVTEQYPQGLGSTVEALRTMLGDETTYYSKTSFSCLGDAAVRDALAHYSVKQWVLAGLEAHVCVLQSAKDLLSRGKNVVVLNDAISSRSIFDYSTAIAELRDYGARITSTETVLFELLKDSKAPEFKQISQIIQCSCC